MQNRWGISKEQLTKLVQKYMTRGGLDDEIAELKTMGADPWIESGLETNKSSGIYSSSIEGRRSEYGSNMKEVEPAPSFMELLWGALNDFTLIILIVCAFVSMAINLTFHEDKSIAWIEGAAILSAVAISSLIGAYNDWEKEKKFVELNEVALKGKKCQVIRDGVTKDIGLGEVVVGDVVKIQAGSEVAGDGYVIEAHSVECDESSMTGESESKRKECLAECEAQANSARAQGETDHNVVPSPILLAGSQIMGGVGAYIILNVGECSAIGRIQAICEEAGDEEDECTPLQMKLETIARDIGQFGLISAIFTVVFMFIRFGIDLSRSSQGWDSTRHPGELVGYFIIGITIIVVAIPEGLPLAVTLSLAYSVNKMLTEHNLVRKLASCETMGGAQEICTDKTGTLTMNEMTLTNFWNGSKHQTWKDNVHYSYVDFIAHQDTQTLFVDSIAINSTEDIDSGSGNASELALLKYLSACGIQVSAYREKAGYDTRYPFSSKRKRTSTVVKDDRSKLGHYVFMRGASEYILEACSHIKDLKTGASKKITADDKKSATDAIHDMATNGLRTITVAYKETDDSYLDEKAGENGCFPFEQEGFVLMGIYGIKDVLRYGVADAIKRCNDAGVRVRMVTGDNMVTAKAIGEICGIYNPERGDLCMEGPEFYRQIGGVVDGAKSNKVGLEAKIEEDDENKNADDGKVVGNKEAFMKIAQNLTILARSRPDDKHALVTGLKQLGQVVAVTGDGTNDAPALAKADVGFAMGITGTDVAKSACDIMIMNDNFCSIVSAIVWGRNIYDSIRKFLQFQLTVNVVAVVGVFIGACILRQAIVNAVQMLWLNLIMDTLASLALATETPHAESLLARKPHSRDDYIISKKMFKHIVGHSFVQLIVTLWLVFQGDKFLPWGADDGQADTDGTVISGRYFFVRNGEADYIDNESTMGPSAHFTYVFNIFVWMQIFNFMNARKINDEINVLEGLGRAPLFCVIMVIICVLQYIIIQFGGRAIGCVNGGFNSEAWTMTLFVGAISLPVSFVMKLLSEDLLCPCTWGSVETDPFANYANTAVGMKRSLSSIRRMSTTKLGSLKKKVSVKL